MNNNNVIIHSTLEEGYNFFIVDKWKVKQHFKISTFKVPRGWLSEAFEVIGDSRVREPRVYHVLSGFDCVVEQAESKLKEKVKKELFKLSQSF